MPFKPEPVQPDFSSLVTSLDNSGVQTSNYSLYQTILFLIQNVQKARALLVADIQDIDQQLSEIFAATFLTVNLETNDFPNSRQLLAGAGILFDDTVAGRRTISTNANNYYDSPLSDGDESAADLIFGNGDPIICQVPNVP